MDAHGVTLQLSGRVENPNPIGLTVAYVDYALELDGRPAGGGRVTTDVRLPAGGSVSVLVPTRLRWVDVPDLVTLLATRTAVPVRVSGVSVVPGAGALPYEATGEVVLPRLPRVALAGTSLRESNLLQTTVELRLEVENPNDFPLPDGRLAYDLSLSGVSVARAATHTLAGIPARGRAVLVVPARFSTVGAAAGVLSGALGGRGEVAFRGRAGFGSFEVGLDARTPLVRR
jgi:LEA14-like dessication related protein